LHRLDTGLFELWRLEEGLKPLQLSHQVPLLAPGGSRSAAAQHG